MSLNATFNQSSSFKDCFLCFPTCFKYSNIFSYNNKLIKVDKTNMKVRLNIDFFLHFKHRCV